MEEPRREIKSIRFEKSQPNDLNFKTENFDGIVDWKIRYGNWTYEDDFPWEI